MPIRPRLAALASLPVLFAPATQAAGNELGVITITAAPFVSEAQISPSHVDVLEGEEKRRLEQASLGRMLEALPGVSSIETGSQVGNPVIRGLSGNRIRVLNDGIAQDYQQYGVRHPANVDPFLASRLEVVRGPMSVLYGSDALGGVINVIPESIPDAPGGSRLDGRLRSAYASNNDERSLGASVSAARGGWGLTAAGTLRRADDIHAPDATTFGESGQIGAPRFSDRLEHTDYESANGSIGLGYRGERGEIALRHTDWNREQNFLLPNGAAVGQNLENRDWDLSGRLDLAGGWALKSTLHAQRNVRQAIEGAEFSALDDQTADLDIRRDRDTARLGVEHPDMFGWKGEVGAEVVRIDQELRRGGLTPDAEREELALYAFEQRDFGPVRLQAGARVDHITQSAERSAAFPTIDTAERDYNVASGSLGAAWQVDDRWTLRANLGRGFRAPSIFELYADGVHGGVAAIQQGDPSLEEETSLNADLGVEWRHGGSHVRATVYQNRIDNYIYLANTGATVGPLPVYQARQDDARLRGIELSGRWQATAHWALEAGYDAVRGELTNDVSDLPLMPADTARAALVFEHAGGGLWRDWQARLEVKHAFDKDAAGPYEPFAQFDNTPFGTASTDAYTLVGIGGGVSLPWQGERVLTLRLAVDNLLNEEYRDFLDTYKGYALGMGRNVRLSAELTF